MKTLFILIALLAVNIHPICSTVCLDDKNIVIEKGSSIDPDEIRPRTPIAISITCTYNEGTLYFTFMEDLGEMEITVTHSSMGIVSASEYDSAYGSVLVPVSSESGSYLIEIVTETGEYYYGEYTL